MDDSYHKFMIVSFVETTLVLKITNDKVSQIHDSGFQVKEATLHTNLLEGGIFIQVTRSSLIQI